MAYPTMKVRALAGAIAVATGLCAGASAWAQPAWMKEAPAKESERQVNRPAERRAPERRQPADAGPRRPTQQPADMGPRPPSRVTTPDRDRGGDRGRDHDRGGDRDHRDFGRDFHDRGSTHFGSRHDWRSSHRHDSFRHDFHKHPRSSTSLHLRFGTGYSGYDRYRYDPYYYDRYSRDSWRYPAYRERIYIYNSPGAYVPVYPDAGVGGVYDYDPDLYLPSAGRALEEAREAERDLSPATLEQLAEAKRAAAAEKAARAWEDLAAGRPSMADFAELLVTDPEDPMHRLGYALGAARSGQPDRAEWAVRSALTLDALSLLRIPSTVQPAAAEALKNYAAENRPGEEGAITLTALRLMAGDATGAAESLGAVRGVDAAAEGLRLAVATALGAG